jgi:hypothetical protein
MERERIEMPRAFEMAGPVIGRRAGIDEDHVVLAAMRGEPWPIDEKFIIA